MNEKLEIFLRRKIKMPDINTVYYKKGRKNESRQKWSQIENLTSKNK